MEKLTPCFGQVRAASACPSCPGMRKVRLCRSEIEERLRGVWGWLSTGAPVTSNRACGYAVLDKGSKQSVEHSTVLERRKKAICRTQWLKLMKE